MQKQIPKFCLLMSLLSLFIVTACSSAPPSVTPTNASAKLPAVNMKQMLTDFLANLPADGHLISHAQVAAQKPFLVDVRQPDEYAQGFIAGAVNIPLRELAKNLAALPDIDQDIVVVDSTGHRGAIGMAVLQMLGYKKAKTLEGGLQAWQAAKQPIVTSPIPQRTTGTSPNVNAGALAALDYYLVHTLPTDWGIIDRAGLDADQARLPSSSSEAMPETYDQGPSILIDVDTPDEFKKSTLADFKRGVNIPLREMPTMLDTMPLQEIVDWA